MKLPSWLRWVCGGLVGLFVIGLISFVVVYWAWFRNGALRHGV